MSLSGILGINDKTRCKCPSCGRGEKDNTFGITRDDRGLVGHCFRCGYVETEFSRLRAALPSVPRSRQRNETLALRWRDYWETCKPVRCSIGEQYLFGRGCSLPPVDGDVRFVEHAWHPIAQREFPALVALATDAADCRLRRTLHFTYLRSDGDGKADIDPAKRLLKGHRKAGAVIRLWPDEAVTYALSVTEGIETALALAHAFAPVWSCIDAGNLAQLPVLHGVESLTIGVDHDAAGIDAAERCAARWFAAGRQVRLVTPEVAGSDIADELAT